MSQLWALTAAGLRERFAAGEASPVEALDASLKRIAELDPALGAFTSVLEESARRQAEARTAELAEGHVRGPLHGVPVAVKELFDVVGAPADYGSLVLAGRTADRDAHLVAKLRRAGAVIVGTTRSHEFGWGITTQHATRGGTRNPWDPGRVPGGSSGGSAAAVATGMVPVAVASDTGGSIRIPASFCGVAGLKPTRGRIGRTGGVALAPSLDTPGALARSIDDAAALVSVMSGPDPEDPICGKGPWRHAPSSPASLHGRRIGVADALADVGLSRDVRAVFEAAMAAAEALGAELVEVDLPSGSAAFEAFVPLQMAEAHDVHHRTLGLFPDRSADYGHDVRSRLEAAAGVTVAEYLAADEERRRITAAFNRVLSTVDAVISPISAGGPSRIERSDEGELDGERRPLRDVVMPYTVPQNLTGLPVGIVRAGFDADGLPVGVQLTAARWRETTAVGLASALQFELGSIGLAAAAADETGDDRCR